MGSAEHMKAMNIFEFGPLSASSLGDFGSWKFLMIGIFVVVDVYFSN